MSGGQYDKLFSRLFSRREAAADLVRNILPEDILERIDLASARVERTSFVDEKLRRHMSDLLIRFEQSEAGPPPEAGQAPPRGELYVYVLVDHKSSPEKWVPFQWNGAVEQLAADGRPHQLYRGAGAHSSIQADLLRCE